MSCYQYDTSSISGACGTSGNCVGRLTNAWTQPANTACTGAPASGSYLSLKSILSYDPMGRPTGAQQQQCVGSHCSAATPYSLTMAYDLAGNMKNLTNSVGANLQPLTLSSYFDTASRPCLTTSDWSVNFPKNLFEVNPSSGSSAGYAPTGALQNWYMGSPSVAPSTDCSATPTSSINITQGYTNRMWPQSIAATGQTQ